MDPLDALGDAQLRRALLFVRSRPQPVTAAEASNALGVPRTAIRHRLERLAAAGLLETAFARRTGRSGPGAGRPAKTYAPAVESGHVEFPARRYERLLELTLRELPRRGRSARLRGIGVAFGEELAAAARLRAMRRPDAALERLCRGLGSLGFHASLESVSAGEAVIRTATCPLRPLVVAHAESRPLDQGMWSGLAGAVLPGATIECETGSCLEPGSPCRVRFTFRG